MDDDELIERDVRQHEAWNDPEEQEYLDGKYKQSMWKKIGQELKHPVVACKTRWHSIRDSYRKSLKSRFQYALTDQIRNIKEKTEDRLGFLAPFLKRGRNRQLLQEEDDGPELLSSFELSVEQSDNKENCAPTPSTSAKMMEVETDDAANTTPPPCRPVKRSNKRHRSENDKDDLTVVDYHLDRQYVKDIPTTNHNVDAFLSSIGATLKMLSPYELNVAKTKIFSIVQDAEMQHLISRRKRPEEQARSYERMESESAPTIQSDSQESRPEDYPCLIAKICSPIQQLSQKLAEESTSAANN